MQEITNKLNGNRSIDIRLMYTPADGAEIAPTKKGVRFSAEILPDVVKALTKGLSDDAVESLMNDLSNRLSDEGV